MHVWLRLQPDEGIAGLTACCVCAVQNPRLKQGAGVEGQLSDTFGRV